MMAVVVCTTLTLVPIVGNTVADQSTAARSNCTTDEGPFAPTRQGPNASATGTTDQSTLAGTDAAVMVARVIVKVALRARWQRGHKCRCSKRRSH